MSDPKGKAKSQVVPIELLDALDGCMWGLSWSEFIRQLLVNHLAMYEASESYRRGSLPLAINEPQGIEEPIMETNPDPMEVPKVVGGEPPALVELPVAEVDTTPAIALAPAVEVEPEPEPEAVTPEVLPKATFNAQDYYPTGSPLIRVPVQWQDGQPVVPDNCAFILLTNLIQILNAMVVKSSLQNQALELCMRDVVKAIEDPGFTLGEDHEILFDLAANVYSGLGSRSDPPNPTNSSD